MRLIACIVLGLAVAVTAAFGYSSYVSKVPNGSVFSCQTCHKEKKFKADFANNGHKWDAALAVKDSDGDGATNGVELQDPNGNWRENDPDPHINGWDTYNPDDHNSTPPYAAVAPASFGRIKALYN